MVRAGSLAWKDTRLACGRSRVQIPAGPFKPLIEYYSWDNPLHSHDSAAKICHPPCLEGMGLVILFIKNLKI